MKPYSAARSGAYVYVRAHGLSNMKTAPVLHAFLEAEISDGVTEVVIDLSDCTGMDSTFMGTMVGFAQNMHDQGGRLVVVNPGENNLRLLETLGVTTVLPVLEASDLKAIDLQLEPLEYGPAQSSGDRMAMIKKAHENLVKLSDENQVKFEPFLQALQKDLDQRDQAAKDAPPMDQETRLRPAIRDKAADAADDDSRAE